MDLAVNSLLEDCCHQTMNEVFHSDFIAPILSLLSPGATMTNLYQDKHISDHIKILTGRPPPRLGAMNFIAGSELQTHYREHINSL